MPHITPEERQRLSQLQHPEEDIRERYPALVDLLARCQNPERDQQILTLAFIYDQPPDEIAKRLGLSRAVVSHVVAAAQRYLRAPAEPHATVRAETSPMPRAARGRVSRRTRASVVEGDPNDEEAPAGAHVESALMGLLLGYVPSNPIIHQHIARHLVRCEQCQIALGTMVGNLTLGADAPDPVRARGERALLQLRITIQRTRSRSRSKAGARQEEG